MAKLADYELPPWVLDWIADFLTDRKQRVKLAHNCYSDWGSARAGVPQGTKLGPWLFLVMINDINVNGLNLWKYVDDTSIGTLSIDDFGCHGRSPEVLFHLSSAVAMDTPSVLDERSHRQCRIA